MTTPLFGAPDPPPIAVLVLEASGLSMRAFARVTGCATDRVIFRAAGPEKISQWLAGLAASGIRLSLVESATGLTVVHS